MSAIDTIPVQCAGVVGFCCYRLQEHSGGPWKDIGGKHISMWNGEKISHGVCPDCLAAYRRHRAAEKRRKESNHAC